MMTECRAGRKIEKFIRKTLLECRGDMSWAKRETQLVSKIGCFIIIRQVRPERLLLDRVQQDGLQSKARPYKKMAISPVEKGRPEEVSLPLKGGGRGEKMDQAFARGGERPLCRGKKHRRSDGN